MYVVHPIVPERHHLHKCFALPQVILSLCLPPLIMAKKHATVEVEGHYEIVVDRLGTPVSIQPIQHLAVKALSHHFLVPRCVEERQHNQVSVKHARLNSLIVLETQSEPKRGVPDFAFHSLRHQKVLCVVCDCFALPSRLKEVEKLSLLGLSKHAGDFTLCRGLKVKLQQLREQGMVHFLLGGLLIRLDALKQVTSGV